MHTSGVVLDLIRRGRASSRAELARELGLARSTVTARIDALISHGLIEETELGSSTGGRPPRILRLNTAQNHVIGVDLGATHCRVTLADIEGLALAAREEPLLITDGPHTVLDRVDTLIQELLDQEQRSLSSLRAIGIGVPGPVEFASGRPVNPPIMPGWHEFPIPGFLGERYDVDVLVDNDVNVLALGERHTAHPNTNHLLFVKVGTGIGCGIVASGALHRGAQGSAGDLGHVRVPGSEAAVCRCGNTGCLEAVAGGAALATRLTEQHIPAETGRDVVRLVESGNATATRMVRDGGRVIGDVLAGVVNFFNPEAIVVGGVLARAHEPLLAGMREVIYKRSLPLATHHLDIVPTKAGEEGGALGAAQLAIDHVLEPTHVQRSLAATAPGDTTQSSDPQAHSVPQGGPR